MNSFCKVIVLFLHVSFFCSSCATIFNGTKQQVAIDSKPQGATVKIQDKVIGITPLFVKLPTKKPVNLVFSYTGYADRTYFLDHQYEWRWLLLDVPATFPYVNIPFAIDVITQSPYRFVEKKVILNFDSIYAKNTSVNTPIDSAEVAKRLSVEQQLLEIEKEMAVLKKEERRIFVEEERKRKLTQRQEKIRTQWLIDSTAKSEMRRSYDSSRVRNHRAAVRFKNSVSIELSSILIGESRLEYHRTIYKGLSIGLELGYKPAYYRTHSYSNLRTWDKNEETREITAMPFAESYYLGLATKIPIFALGRGKYYVSFVSFLRNSSFDHAVISWDEKSRGSSYHDIPSYKDSLNVHQNTYGLKVLFGFRKIFAFEKIALEFDTYAGFSLRNVTTELFHYKTERFDYYYNPSPTIAINKAERRVDFIPTIQAGVKVGVRF